MAKDLSKLTDPIKQFDINEIFSFGTIGADENGLGGFDLVFTNSALFMVISVALISGYLILTTRGRGLVPSRLQLVSEMSYEFIANMIRTTAGSEGMKFFPFVFSLFSFILITNMLGLFPYFISVTSQLIITVSLSLLVMSIVIVYGVYKNGFGFLKLFVPSGIPLVVLFIVVPIEILSFLSRPLSLSLRLFGNMLAGAIVVKVFAGFVVMLSTAGFLGIIGAILPFGMTVALTGLEILVAALQAFVFTILTCVYLNDAIHPGH
ncbi:ATP synthase F0 sector subunit a [hydrothermal vent metagenome]|uniref:ATP synthase F0 sector subunit a n=1 Tax=hydrothermal vent metagenome TaxID=652676 RepID=A0A3B0WVB2_9ZZZZ